MSDKNLELWSAVEKTDTSFTKEYSGAGGFKGTSINSLYLIKKATEQWGPIGGKWGFNIIEERFDEGIPMINKDGVNLGTSKLHTMKIEVFYPSGKVQNYGHTPFVYMNKWGAQVDSDPCKKSLTDALSKCLSMLGFGGDVHLGLFDDVGYKQMIETEQHIEKAINKDEAYNEKLNELINWVEKESGCYELLPNMSSLVLANNKNVKSLSMKAQALNIDPAKLTAKFTKAFEARAAKLKEEK